MDPPLGSAILSFAAKQACFARANSAIHAAFPNLDLE